ncbi:hypothetical protein QTH97_26795 [Variovorax sp. J22R24]|uniref:hypothetical protein n=1 Tax=Variovorax gracilis TaxID=3053502 RepID=UPI0025772404|nr:hypothetical protein [Variovorax sp. J22R24]MDM0108583.1 hypothetical protein [Variovorax sp. J22R24]
MKSESGLPRWQLVEVWGDTADVRHLAWAIVLGIGISLPAYLLAARVLTAFVSSPELAKAYGMLAGLGGCVVAGVMCALLFKPKRVVVEGEAADPFWRQEVLAKLAEQIGDLGSVADLPPGVVQEMKELQIYDLFLDYEKSNRIEKPSTDEPPRQRFASQPSVLAAQVKGA